MTAEAKLMSGIILLTVPTIEYGGAFLLSVLGGKYSQLGLTAFQKSMFRAGHAHAGVLVILALVAQPFIDEINFSTPVLWTLRTGFPTAALLVSGGFFAAAAGKNAEKPNKWIVLIYVGMLALAASLIITGLGLMF